MNRIFLILVLAVAAVLGTSWYIHRSRVRAMNSGDVFVREQPGDKAPSANQPAPTQEVATNTSESQGVGQPSVHPQVTATPASDTIPRNPPNGTMFAGTGKYQVYRQGDITWRLNTETGDACVLFATQVQWSKMLVYQHGCGSS